MYITGIGRTPFGKLNETLPELAKISSERALEDASLDIKDIDAIFVSNFCGGPTQHQLHINSLMSDVLRVHGIPIIRIETACASGGSSLHQALISLSHYTTILIIGIEKLTNNPKMATTGISMASDRINDQLNGLIFPAAYALIASEYMRRYDLTLDDLAEISYKNHMHANLNEKAHFYGKEIRKDMIMNSPVVSSPLRLYDCSPISDGGCSIIVSKKKRSKRDVKIIASALSTGPLSITNLTDLTSFPAARMSAKKAYTMAGIKPKDIDIACVHDCFTIAEVLAMEDLGFCSKGEAKKLIRNKKTWINADIPINTDGGLKADGHPIGASGLAQIYELVVQLRYEAGKRQVNKATIGLAHNIGGIGGTAVIHILKKV